MAEALDPRRNRRRLLVLLASVIAIPFVAELGLRWMLFGTDPVAQRLGEDLRRAGLYARADRDEAYWKLRAHFEPDLVERIEEHLEPDPIVGWRSRELLDDRLVHTFEAQLGDRRPVLFFGASFVTPDYTGLLQASDLGPTHGLLTFGVGGFGLGQSTLLARHTLERFDGREPLVLLAVVIDADLPRACLAVREGAKPSFELGPDGRLFERPFSPGSLRDVAEREPVGIDSYLLAWLRGAGSPVAREVQAWGAELDDRAAQMLAVNQALIASARDAASQAGGEFAVVLFNGPDSLARPPAAIELELIEFLDAQSIAYMDSRRMFNAAREAGHAPAEFFWPPGHVRQDHPNGDGQVLIAGLLRLAMAGHRDSHAGSPDPYRILLQD